MDIASERILISKKGGENSPSCIYVNSTAFIITFVRKYRIRIYKGERIC